MRIVVAYDISSDNDRARVAAVLATWGDRLQRSVFTCTVDSDELDELAERIRGLINERTDVVQVFRQCATCDDRRVDVGQPRFPRRPLLDPVNRESRQR